MDFVSISTPRTTDIEKRSPGTGAGVALTVGAAVCPLLAVLAPLALVPLILVLAAATLLTTPCHHLWNKFPVALGAILGVVVLWGAASAFWTDQPSVSLHKSAQLFFLFLAIAVLIAGARSSPDKLQARMDHALVAGFLAAVGLLLVERFFQVPLASQLASDASDKILLLKRYNRGTTVLAILLCPATLVVLRRYGRAAAAGFAALVIATLVLMESRAAMIAAVVGAVIFVAGPVWRRLAVATSVAAVMAALILPFVLPVIAHRDDPQPLREQAIQFHVMSAMHRMSIWEFTVERIRDHPVLGWGLGYSRHLPEGKVATAYYGEKLPLHPHNAVLQIQVELGAVGTLLAAGLAALGIAHARRQPARSFALGTLLATLVSILVIASISYGVWQSWWIAAIGLAGVYSEAMTRDRAP